MYIKTFDGSVNVAPPTGGGGGGGKKQPAFGIFERKNFNAATGFVRNVVVRSVSLDRVDRPVHIYQTNDAVKSVRSAFKLVRLTFCLIDKQRR